MDTNNQNSEDLQKIRMEVLRKFLEVSIIFASEKPVKESKKILVRVR